MCLRNKHSVSLKSLKLFGPGSWRTHPPRKILATRLFVLLSVRPFERPPVANGITNIGLYPLYFIMTTVIISKVVLMAPIQFKECVVSQTGRQPEKSKIFSTRSTTFWIQAAKTGMRSMWPALGNPSYRKWRQATVQKLSAVIHCWRGS